MDLVEVEYLPGSEGCTPVKSGAHLAQGLHEVPVLLLAFLVLVLFCLSPCALLGSASLLLLGDEQLVFKWG